MLWLTRKPSWLVALFLLFGLSSCQHLPLRKTAPAPPPMLLGEWRDDYNSRYTITPTTWTHHPRSTYEVIAWHPDQNYVIARNADDNPSEAGLYTRIDWMPLSDMAPYAWAFCLSAYDAPTAQAAEAVAIANRDTPRTGCNGFPFSRMRQPDDG